MEIKDLLLLIEENLNSLEKGDYILDDVISALRNAYHKIQYLDKENKRLAENQKGWM